MNDNTQLPVSTKQINSGDSFNFSCHKGVSCFTECCRMLELALSPYDVLRLRYSTGKNSSELLNEYIIEEQDPAEPFPRFYLTMVDDGRASCVFVAQDGCTVYKDRPAACRTYPLGRAAQLGEDGSVQQNFILIEENHCQGFQEEMAQTPLEYTKDQELEQYNSFNDSFASILQHKAIRQGFIPSKKQIELFTLALYDLDRFRQMIVQRDLIIPGTDAINMENDEQLLNISLSWISTELYSQFG